MHVDASVWERLDALEAQNFELMMMLEALLRLQNISTIQFAQQVETIRQEKRFQLAYRLNEYLASQSQAKPESN
jgi:hypothetical protein